MANELQAQTTTGLTLYAVLISAVGQVWNTSGTPGFETYNGANWTDYDIALTEAGAGIYLGDMPGAAAGVYSYAVYSQAGASPATTDTLKGSGWLAWDGSAEVIPVGRGYEIETLTFEEILRILLAQAAGKSSGGGTSSVVFRDQADTKDRLELTVDANGNRSATAVDGT